MMLGLVPPEPGYLEAVRDITRRHGVVLIFDEVKTGLTVAAGGAVERYGVTPDLVTLAKALGGGSPSGAIGGTEEVMSVVEDGRVLQVGTYNGNALGMAAARANLLEVLTPDAYVRLDELSERMVSGCTSALVRRVACPATRSAWAREGASRSHQVGSAITPQCASRKTPTFCDSLGCTARIEVSTNKTNGTKR